MAISLGHINRKNNNDPEINFNNAGEYWHKNNLWLWKRELRAGIYSTGYERLLRRKRVSVSFWDPFPHTLDHIVNVTQMQEIDNAPGSYLKGAGNIISVTDWAHFTLQNIFNGKNFFSHKSTFTALGINPNLWPSDGSHTLDMQGLDLMFTNYQDLNSNPQIQSNYFGYPNLGRPNDHFDVTPL